jgi:hypothetical protein
MAASKNAQIPRANWGEMVVQMGQWGMVWEGRTGKAYEAACDVDAKRTALLAQIDVVEEWEGIQADTARVIV